MKFQCPLIAVKDMDASKRFYCDLFDQKVVLDFGANVTMSGGFALQQGFAELVGLDPDSVCERSHNMELYFEVDDFEAFERALSERSDIELVHGTKTYPWLQRVIRIYDPDHHIIEIGESMVVIARRLLDEGFSVEEVSEKIQHPLAFVEMVAAGGQV